MTISQIAKAAGISRNTLRCRLKTLASAGCVISNQDEAKRQGKKMALMYRLVAEAATPPPPAPDG